MQGAFGRLDAGAAAPEVCLLHDLYCSCVVWATDSFVLWVCVVGVSDSGSS